MPNIELTENLRRTIKTLRKSKKKRGDELSKELGKGASYISQIESGKIKEIDFGLLNKIFHIITDLSDKQFENFMDSLLDETASHLSDEEIQHEKWVHQFNHEIRQFPILDSLIDFIKTKLNELHYTPEEFVDIINQNRGVEEIDKMEPNKLNIEIIDAGNGTYGIFSSIRFVLPRDFITKILSKETKTVSYINMQGIIFNLFLSDNNTYEMAHQKTDQVLLDNQFYTIRQRNKIIRENIKKKQASEENFTFYDAMPTDYDKKYVQLKDDIGSGFDFLRDKDILYACERLEALQKNMHDDLGFITAIMATPLHRIKKELKKDFWTDYLDLVKRYIDESKDKNSQ